LFKIGLERNKTIKKMPLPLVDLANIIKAEHASHTAQAGSNLSEIVKLANEIQQLVFDNALNISSTQESYVDLWLFFNSYRFIPIHKGFCSGSCYEEQPAVH
jgi:hypothetical protein